MSFAVQPESQDEAEKYVIKRIRSEDRNETLLSGQREAYFGSLLRQKSYETNYLVRSLTSSLPVV